MSVMDMNSRMAMAEKLSVQQLQQAVQSGSLPAYIGIPLIEQKTKERAQMAAAQQGQQKPPSVAASILQQADEQEQQERGIDELPSNLPMMEDEEVGMAGGGIIAFAEAGAVVDPYSTYGDIDPLAQFSGLTQADVDRDIQKQLKERRDKQREADIRQREFLMRNAPGSVASFDFGAGEFEAINSPTAPQAPQADADLDNRMLVDSNAGITATPGAKLAPEGTPGAPKTATAGSTSPTRSAAPPSTLAAAERSDSPAANQATSMLDKYVAMLEKSGEDVGRQKKEALYMALIQGGLGIMGGTSPNAFANIAAGAVPAVTQYQAALKDIRKEDRDRIKQLMELGLGKEKLAMELKKLGIEGKKVDAMVNYYNARAGAAGAGGGGNDIKTANAIRALDSQLSTNLSRVDTQIKNLNSANPMMAAYVNKSPDQIPKGIRDQVTAYKAQLGKLEGEKNKWINLHSSRVQSLGGVTLGDIEGASGGGNAPAVGTVKDGYRFKGGNPGDPKSWEKV